MRIRYLSLQATLVALTILPAGFTGTAQSTQLTEDSLSATFVQTENNIIGSPKQQSTKHAVTGNATVLKGTDIDLLGIETIKDLSAWSPNLFIPDFGTRKTTSVFLRGIGSFFNEPAVGLFVDNIAYFDEAVYDFNLLDIDRIEVLRGPQGALFGRNTMGGAINIISRSPFEHQGTKVKLSVGNYGNYQGGINHLLKISERFAYSVSFNYQQRDGFYTNVYDDKSVDHLISFGLRNRLIWRLSNNFSIENRLTFEYNRQGGLPMAMLDENNKPGEINFDAPFRYNRDLLSNALVLEYNADILDLIATSAYQYLDGFEESDYDFSASPVFQFTQTQLQHMFSQEVMLKAKPNQRLEWLAGIYIFFQQLDRNNRFDDLEPNKVHLTNFYNNKQGMTMFAQVSYNDMLVKGLSATFGIRMTGEQHRLIYRNDLFSNGQMNYLTDTLFVPMEYGQTTPKFTINYALDNNTNFYFLTSQAYNNGGYNANLYHDEDLINHLEYDPETSTNYEIGASSAFFQGRLSADATLFYIKWTNQQILQRTPDGLDFMIKNAGESVSQGVELSLFAKPFKNFTAKLCYGLTDARFVAYPVDSTLNYDDNYIPFVPRNTFSLQLGKRFNLPENAIAERIDLSMNFKSIGKHYWNVANTQLQDAYGLLDFRFGIKRGGLKLDLWAKNMLGTEYSAFYMEFPHLLGRFVQPSKPSLYGLSISVDL